VKRFFNTTGPCVPGDHYMLPASVRCGEIFNLIERKQYFVIHAARQSGKTTLLKALATELNAGTAYKALYCSLESVQGIGEPQEGIPAIVSCVQATLAYAGLPDQFAGDTAVNTMLRMGLSRLCAALDRPLVMLFDEVDCLSDGTLITFLRQLRDGYVNRTEGPFPSSCALVGMRNIRDYKARLRPDRDTLGSASPFNIAAESLTLHNFTQAEVGELYGQHAADTGQEFPADAVERAYWWSQGQPWLVNALAREVVDKLLQGDAARIVEAEHLDEAAERLIERRDTHIDSLIERLREERVRKVVEPVLTGEGVGVSFQSDDARYVVDLGLLRTDRGTWEAANPIYREVIARALSFDQQTAMPPELRNRWILDDGLDMTGLLKAFQAFWRENSDIWIEKYDYREAAPHLILQAFLQRVVTQPSPQGYGGHDGGARIDREFALGRQRLDLCVTIGDHRYPVELKVRDPRRSDPEPVGIVQLGEYMDTCGATEGWLVIFDQRRELPWDERIGWKTVKTDARTIHIVRC
jgi:hypothetical protein